MCASKTSWKFEHDVEPGGNLTCHYYSQGTFTRQSGHDTSQIPHTPQWFTYCSSPMVQSERAFWATINQVKVVLFLVYLHVL